jgi:hypothetical protein
MFLWLAIAAFLVLLLLAVLWLSKRGGTRALRAELSPVQCFDWQPTLFVAIASYRDPEVLNTVRWLVERACHPEKLRIVVLEQNEPHDASVKSLGLPQVEVIEMPASEARGPLYARALLREQYSGEDIYVQLDSHLWPRPHWDAAALQDLQQCPAGSVLTNYPNGYDRRNPDGPKDERPTRLSSAGWYDNGARKLEAHTYASTGKPTPERYCAAGFYFGAPPPRWQGELLELTKDLFYGEESIVAARLWTEGCQFYAPSRQIVFHLWDRGYRHTFWEKQSKERKANGARNWAKLKEILEGKPSSLASQLLGTVRSLGDEGSPTQR